VQLDDTHKEPTTVSIWKPEPRIRPITLSRNRPTQPGSKWTRSTNWVTMKRWCIQPHKEDATQGLDKDPSINSHAMVEKKMPCAFSKNSRINISSYRGVHGVYILGTSFLVGCERSSWRRIPKDLCSFRVATKQPVQLPLN
jgi:hypothetical protein